MKYDIEVLFARRSIRKYESGSELSPLDIRQLLEAAMCAPSARNRQPWHFVVITQRNTLQELASQHPYAGMLHSATAAVLVCGCMEEEPEEGYIVQACAAATQNILLACHGKGLGAVWLGVHPRTERIEMVRKLLNVPASILPVSLISIGYPAEKKPRNANYRQSRVHYHVWNP